MTKHCCDFHTLSDKADPTKTLTLRRKFEAEFRKRFTALKVDIVRAVERQNEFNLPEVTANRARFDFPRRQDKVAAFMEWLRQRVDFQIFDNLEFAPRQTAIDNSWMNTFVQTSYRRGLNKAASDVSRAGGRVSPTYTETAFLRPVHADRAGFIFTRTFDGLKGISTEMDGQISRVLAEGLLNGSSPRVIARTLNDRVSKIGITRARMLARSEVIAAHAEAKLTAFEDAGIKGVGLQAEWLTAGDDRVCPSCIEASENGPYVVKDSHGLIPLHINCRCTWIPLIESGKDVALS